MYELCHVDYILLLELFVLKGAKIKSRIQMPGA